MKRPLAAPRRRDSSWRDALDGPAPARSSDLGVAPASAGDVDRAGRASGPDLSGAAERIEGLARRCARRGDVAAYLAAFERTAPRPAGARGRRARPRRLRRRPPPHRRARARATPSSTAEPDGDAPTRRRITVESTFADRIERQTFRLARVDSGWLITDVETARDHVPAQAARLARRPTRSPRASRWPPLRRAGSRPGSDESDAGGRHCSGSSAVRNSIVCRII